MTSKMIIESISALIIGILGCYFIVIYGSWYLLLGIFLFCWSNNIHIKHTIESSINDKTPFKRIFN